MKFVIHRVVSHQPLFVRITVCNFPSISLAMDAFPGLPTATYQYWLCLGVILPDFVLMQITFR